jgi:hypothetical protein
MKDRQFVHDTLVLLMNICYLDRSGHVKVSNIEIKTLLGDIVSL